MNWIEYSPEVVGKILVNVFLLAYSVLGVIFYIFCKSTIKNKDGLTTISRNSWHFRIAYPFRKYDRHSRYSDNFFSYFTKVFFMFFLGWPCLILWEVIKMTVALPILLLFGYYAFSDLEVMDKYNNPFLLKIKQLYVPTTTAGFEIFPIYILGTILYIWLVYKWIFVVLALSAVVIGLILILWLVGTMEESELANRILRYWRQSKIKSSIQRIYYSIKKYNYKLRIDGRD